MLAPPSIHPSGAIDVLLCSASLREAEIAACRRARSHCTRNRYRSGPETLMTRCRGIRGSCPKVPPRPRWTGTPASFDRCRRRCQVDSVWTICWLSQWVDITRSGHQIRLRSTMSDRAVPNRGRRFNTVAVDRRVRRARHDRQIEAERSPVRSSTAPTRVMKPRSRCSSAARP